MAEQGGGYIPFFSDISHIGKNIYGSTMHGYDVATDIGRRNWGAVFKPRGTNFGSLGGMLSAFGGVGIGAAAGAMIGSQVASDDMAEGAKTGALVGGAVGAVAPFALGVGMSAGVALGKGALELGASAVSAAPKAFGGMLGLGAQVLNGTATGGIGGTILSPVRRVMGAADKIGNSLFKVAEKNLDPSKVGLSKEVQNLTHVKPTFLGGVALAGTSIISGASKAFNESQRIHMGQMDGQVTRATPMQRMSQPAYSDNAGATGDLVFALNANRRG